MDELVSRFASSEEAQRAWKVLAQAGGACGGLVGGGPALLLAAWRETVLVPGKRAALVVTAGEEEAEELVEGIECFSPGAALHFPMFDVRAPEGSVPDAEVARERLRVVLGAWRGGLEGKVVAGGIQALLEPVPDPEALDRALLVLETAKAVSPEMLAERLVGCGYRRADLVEFPGEFALRGDILDLYPHARGLPLRLEFFDEVLESIREFDPETQRSRGEELKRCELLLLPAGEIHRGGRRGLRLWDLLKNRADVLLWEPDAIRAKEALLAERIGGDGVARLAERLLAEGARTLWELPAPPAAGSAGDVGFGSVESFASSDAEAMFGRLRDALESGLHVRVVCESEAEARRFTDLAADHGIERGTLEVVEGRLRRGFSLPGARAVVLTTRELFDRRTVRRFRSRAAPPSRAVESFLELRKGDYVVHIVHGIGRFLGLEVLEKDGVEQEFLAIEYRGGVKLYVPVSRADLVQKYIGCGDHQPVLDRVGGTAWQRKKDAVEAALMDLAAELLELQALRQARPGIAYPEDSEWQRQFEAAFPYPETPDQIEVAEAIKRDMQAPRPMDRLVCGDVGFGKTELAMRAAFKAVDAGRQVAVLVPTTVLAEQHYRTFRERMAEFPITVEMLSRFRTPAQQREVIERTAAGAVDILIGTHRLLSSDVRFRDLGLVIVDEEQRFGVVHKEKLKRMRSQVDVLTLSATPIPRTLHMALLGIRDISSLTTPPQGRHAILTEIWRYDRRRVRNAILDELGRDGQVYFIHNRVQDIEYVVRELRALVPEARIDYAHGQMSERELERRMLRFFDRKIDVLVATTIIENGIDIPTVNTIFINEADRYGLADLHQLRGRVGRYKQQAYCYLLLPDHRHVSPEARRRLEALVEFSDLGAGFQIAMRDLEIRGAGNILGKEQSGHIATVGYDLYCKLLEKCVRKLREEPYEEPCNVEVELAIDARIPDEYVAAGSVKIEIYRRIAQAGNDEELEALREELVDRFGCMPLQVRRLFDLQRFRLRCRARGIDYVGRREEGLVLRGDRRLEELLAQCPMRIVVLDPHTVAIPLEDPRRRYAPPPSDMDLFERLDEWLRTGRWPSLVGPRRRFEVRSEEREAAGVALERASRHKEATE